MPMRCPTNDGTDVCGPTCVGVVRSLSFRPRCSNPVPLASPCSSLSLSLSLFLSPLHPVSLQVSTSCLDTGMDLTGIFSPPDIRLATKIGETQRGGRARPRRASAWAGQRYGCEDHARDLLDLSITGDLLRVRGWLRCLVRAVHVDRSRSKRFRFPS